MTTAEKNSADEPTWGDQVSPESNSAKAKQKKQIPLRLSKTLYNEIAEWADAEFRSINGQIEYLLSEAVRKRKGSDKDA